jgi:hypothetical protein
MSMMEHYTREQAQEALEDALNMKEVFYKEIDKLNNYIFFLKYFLATGDALEIDVIEFPEGAEDE